MADRANDAIKDANAALDLEPGSAFLLELRGRCFEAAGQRDKAIADFKEALRVDPSIKTARLGLARLDAKP
jgi:tetratricopeptide (TPR) repeat protein